MRPPEQKDMRFVTTQSEVLEKNYGGHDWAGMTVVIGRMTLACVIMADWSALDITMELSAAEMAMNTFTCLMKSSLCWGKCESCGLDATE